MPQVHPIHTGETAYAPPVLRHHSSSSSLGTTYAKDETSFEDATLPQHTFERKMEDALRLNDPSQAEEQACKSVLLPRPKAPEQEKALHEQVMRDLRARVQKLEEDELFEATLLRGSQIAHEPVPATIDIDALMESMMVDPKTSSTIHIPTNGPWNVTSTSTNATLMGLSDRADSVAGWGSRRGGVC